MGKTIGSTVILALFLALGIGTSTHAEEEPSTEGVALFGEPNPALDALLQDAAASGKPVLIMFDAPNCGWCRQLEEQVLTRPEVKSELSHFVLARYIDGDSTATEVIKRFHVRGFPTVLVLSAGGEEIDRVPGYEEPTAFLADLRRIQAGENTLLALLRLGDARSVEQDRILAGQLADADPPRAVEFCDAVLTGREELTDEDQAWLLLVRAEALANDESYESSLQTSERLVREHPETKAGRIASVQAISALLSVSPERALRFVLSAPRPDDPDARAYLDNHAAILHLRAAEACMERQASRHERDAEGLNFVAWDCYRHELSTDKAIEWARQAVALSNRAPHILDTLAHLLFRKGPIEEAIALEREALNGATAEQERQQYEEALAMFMAVKAVREKREGSPTSGGEPGR